jgi:large subunit ribosomal protein L1
MLEEKKEEFEKYIQENKGSRKFKQSIEMAINFKDINFSKQENRINLDVMLPFNKGKLKKIMVFASEKDLIERANKANIEVIKGEDIQAISKDQAKLNSLLNYELLAQPNLMPSIAKGMGQFLGPRNSMPKPLIGNIDFAEIAKQSNKRITLKMKGKFLPTVHCVIGSEDMPPGEIFGNAKEVLEALTRKIGGNRIRSAYVKMTMSKPLRLV